jgi:uncharacterized membrane protein YcaP (DUF421 family)
VDAVLRAAAVYGFLLVVMRLSGKRTLAQVTAFDLVLLLIIGRRPNRPCSETTSRSPTRSRSSPPCS